MNRVMSVQALLESFLAPCDEKQANNKELYRIGDLSKHFDVSLRTLRFYEDRGLLSPKRAGSTRLYSHDDRKRLKIILLAKSVGFSLVDIQELLKIYDADATGNELKTVARKFAGQLEKLQLQKAEIDKSIEELTAIVGSIEKLV